MANDAAPEAPSEVRPEVYDDYDAFIKQAVRGYYAQAWKSRRGHFIAFVIASGQMVSMAADSVRDGSGLRKAAIGTAAVVALRFGLRYFLGGPVGILLSAAVVASAVAYLLKNQKEITAKLEPCRRPHRGHPHQVRRDPGRLPRGSLRRRRPQSDGRRPAEAPAGAGGRALAAGDAGAVRAWLRSSDGEGGRAA
jgi:hypothetical protein